MRATLNMRESDQSSGIFVNLNQHFLDHIVMLNMADGMTI